MEQKRRRYASIDEYIKSFPPDVQRKLTELRLHIRGIVPGAHEKISYQMPAFDEGGILVYFAAYARHIGFYPTSSGIAKFKRELAPYKSSKGAVQFPLDEPLPLELIRRIVEFRAAENAEKARRSRR